MADEKKIDISDDDILDRLKGDLDKAASIQEELAEQRKAYYESFRGALYGNERDGWSKSVARIVWKNHQTTLATLVEIFSDEFFTLKSEKQERSDKFQKLIRYQMFRKQDGYRRLYDFLFDAGLYHFAIFKVYRKEDYKLAYDSYDRLTADELMGLLQQGNRQVTKYTEAEIPGPNGIEKIYEKVKIARKDILYQGPYFEVVPPWQFGYSPDCKLNEWGAIDGRLVYHGPFKLTLNDIRKRERAGIYRAGTFEKCKDLGTDDNKPVDQQAVEYDVDGLSSAATESANDKTDDVDLSKELNVKECYCKLDIDGDGLLEPCIVSIVEDEIVANVEENPYGKPCFRVGGLIPEPHKVNGIAPPSIQETDQKVRTNLLRFIQDQAAMSTYRNVVTSDARMQQMLQTRKPFDVILGDPTKLGEVPVQQADGFVLRAWELLKQEDEETTGNSRLNQGAGESPGTSATEVSITNQGSARRMRMGAKLIGNGPITGLIRDFIFINQKWKSQDPIRLLGTDLVVNPDDLDGDYDIEIDIGVTPGERMQSAQQLDLLVQFGTKAGLPMGLMTPLHILKAQKKKYGLLNINVDDCMKTEIQFKADEEAKKQQPQQDDWREFLQIDKLFPLLTRNEQMQIIQKVGIQPDPQGQVAGIPQAKDLIANQGKAQDAQLKQQEAGMKMQMERESHGMDMQKKQMDMAAGAISHRMAIQKGAIQQNGGNAGR
jgi:hypothetical protein